MHYALFCDRANGEPVVSVAPTVQVVVAVVEAEAVRVDADVVQRSRPVAAVATIVEGRTAAVARSGKEDTVTVRTCHFHAFHSVLGCPLPSTFIPEFFYFCLSRHAPIVAPFCGGHIVRGGEVSIGTDDATRLQFRF